MKVIECIGRENQKYLLDLEKVEAVSKEYPTDRHEKDRYYIEYHMASDTVYFEPFATESERDERYEKIKLLMGI